MLKKLLITCLATSALGVTATTATADIYATALFDKTGSMGAGIRFDGRTRCEYGKELFLQTVGTGIDKGDFLNAKVFGVAGEMRSLTGGFVNVTGLHPAFGAGQTLFNNITAQINAVSCNSGRTALGDALCDSIDELRAQSGQHIRRIGLVTDAGENGSRRCGNSPTGGSGYGYVASKILPHLLTPPPVILTMSILQPGGNVSNRSINNTIQEYDNIEYESGQSDSPATVPGINVVPTPTPTPPLRPEAQALVEAALLSGGGAIVIHDNENCTANCDPESQDDPWGGGW